MRVNGNGIVFYGAGGFRQYYREGDESERLPKLRNFKPDEQSDEAAAGSSKEARNGALPGIITKRCQPGGQIERCAKNRKSEQPHSHVHICRGFEMQIDDHAAIESKCAEKNVLHLQVRRPESAAKSH